MAHEKFFCQKCAKPFIPAPNNESRQKYCTRHPCVATRKRERQNKSHKKLYGESPEFCANTKARVSLWRSSQAALNRSPAAPPPASVDTSVRQTLLGLAAHLSDDPDPKHAEDLLLKWHDHGTRLAEQGVKTG